MRKLTVVASGLMLACLAVGMAAGVLFAQTTPPDTGPPLVYEACRPGEASILATGLPRVVERARCPVEGRAIVDIGGVGTVLPEPGMGVYAELYGLYGGEELEVYNPGDGTFVLGLVGSEPSMLDEGTITTQAISNGCGDGAYNPDPANTGFRLYSDIPYTFNADTTPSNVAVDRAVEAIRGGTQNIAQVYNPCGVGDDVVPSMAWNGIDNTIGTDVNADATCNSQDGKSAVGFGDLPPTWLGAHCKGWYVRDGQDEVAASDVRMNKDDYSWTAEVTTSCSGRYDIEATMTHERGHSFGMYHVEEQTHPVLTMSERSEGACQTSERSLGLGDARGLNQKYP